ncbi:MAG: hypothetical protein GY928_04040 [Colwellia sp.]|nr:hypothetical protein [Colwellia sp.]
MGFGLDNKQEDKVITPFVRDESDNKIFKEIQVEAGSDLITEDTIGCWDFDTPIYKIASNLENKFITVTCKTDKTITDELKGVVPFKGRSSTKVAEGSWLGLLNVERKVAGLDELTPDDFDIVAGQRLKYPDEDKAMEQAKIVLYKNVKKVKQQYGISKVKLLLGQGDTFRNLLPTCRPYKGNRSETLRPLLLKKLRQWVLDNMDAEMTQPRADGQNIECDDRAEHFGYAGYQHYRKHGWFSYIVLSSDKDSFNSAKYLVDPDTHSGKDNPLKGRFKFPKGMLIKATDECAGDVVLVSKAGGAKELKGYGFKFLMFQCALGKDQADNYSALSHLDQGLNFGAISAYETLKPCKTAKETLQATIDTFAKLLPYGVQYTTFDGKDMDMTTLEYMNTYFLVAYMNRSNTDNMDFYKLCKAFQVDTSAIENNNRYTPPKKTYVGSEEHVGEVETLLEDIIKNDFKGLKAMKKADQGKVLDIIKEKLLSVDFSGHYEMKQELKEGFKEEGE